MQRFLAGSCLAFWLSGALFVPHTIVIDNGLGKAEAPVVGEIKPRDLKSADEIREFIVDEALRHEVSPAMAVFVASHESAGFDPKVLTGERVGDSHLTCLLKDSPNYGKPIRSRGIWQINDCAHPDVSDELALDVASSTDWAMPRLKTEPEIWTAYRIWVQKKTPEAHAQDDVRPGADEVY